MIQATIEDRVIEYTHPDTEVRYSVDLDFLSANWQVQADCWEDDDLFLSVALQAILQENALWTDHYEVRRDGEVVYESPNLSAADMHDKWVNPCPECRKKIQEAMLHDKYKT